MHQIRFRLGLRPRPPDTPTEGAYSALLGELEHSPDPLSGFKGPTSKGRGRDGRGRHGTGREGKGWDGTEGERREGRGGEGRGKEKRGGK